MIFSGGDSAGAPSVEREHQFTEASMRDRQAWTNATEKDAETRFFAAF